ncbi:MAG TPA: methyl-accepting chemotaxis protein [Pedomonas sp.]|uniref:methyl-accepting chemotaxis protein n=1 Tax=Pedomonas sp. TaxID=2976421 RepID=UPI002F3ED7B2
MTAYSRFSASLATKLTLIPIGLFLLTVAFALWNIYEARSLKADLAATALTAKARTAHRILYHAHNYHTRAGAARDESLTNLRQQVALTEESLRDLTEGNTALGIKPETHAAVAANLQERQQYWRATARPALDRFLVAQDPAAAAAALADLDDVLRTYSSMIDHGIDLREAASRDAVEFFGLTQWLFSGLILAALLPVVALARSTSGRIRDLAGAANRISGGDLNASAPVEGSDELAGLGESFNAMTQDLRQRIEAEAQGRKVLEDLLGAIAEAVASLTTASAEILAGTSEQAAGMRQQSSAVAQTITTVDEVLQTAEQAAERAKAVEISSQRAVELSAAGEKAVADTTAAMEAVRARTELIAESVVGLAEQAQSIGDIIAVVTDIAEQTNLLALNAAIEASRANEHGRGFTVVANEIKTLAEQSKKATGQVRRILGDIQKATNQSVRVTEEGARSVDEALRTVAEAGATITQLAGIIADAALAAAHISASSGQQATGMAQIRQAMTHINQASSQNLAATRQAEQAAENLNALGLNLKERLSGYGR